MHLLRILSLITLISLSLSSVAIGGVGGALEWGYGQYLSDEGGVESDLSYFAQKYELMLSRSGYLIDDRAGKYNLMLGGEWLSLNSDIDIDGVNSDYKVSEGRLRYLGEINFAPGGLPFRFNAYARDIDKMMFESRSNYGSGWMEELVLSTRSNTILTPNVYSDVSDGQHFEIGASLTVGIKNGSYLGRYRNILSHLPKVYFDYRERQTQDFNSRTPEDYIDRELAFVSLNKKHNWFHYRFYDHIDNLNPALNSATRSYLLGTIDQYMHREWINLTNWIQLSVDGGYTVDSRPSALLSNNNRYALNLFTKTRRRNWSSFIFSRFYRLEKYTTLERVAQVPVVVSWKPSRDDSWRLRFIGTAKKTNIPFGLVSRTLNHNGLYAKSRWETNKTQRYAFSPQLEVEKKFGDRGEGWAARSTFEYFSNRGFRPSVNTFSSLTLGYFRGVPAWPIRDTNLFEVGGNFDVSKRFSRRLRSGFQSFLLLGVGQSDPGITDYVKPLSQSGFTASNSQFDDNVVTDGTVWRGRLKWFADHVSVSRASNRYELSAEYQDNGISGAGQYMARHHLRYDATPYQIRVLSEFLYGDNLSRAVSSRAFGVSLVGSGFDGLSFSNESKITYFPNRRHRLNGRLLADYRDSNLLGAGSRVALQQDYAYTSYVSSGVVRRLFALREYLDYERFDPAGDSYFEAVSLTFEGDYYPFSWTRFGGKARLQHDLDSGVDVVGFGLYTDFTFSRLKVGLEYEYGMRTHDDAGVLFDRTEQSWNISIKKTF